MVKDTIQAVKEAEERAAEMIQKASDEGKALVNQAKSEASKMRRKPSGKPGRRPERSGRNWQRKAQIIWKRRLLRPRKISLP